MNSAGICRVQKFGRLGYSGIPLRMVVHSECRTIPWFYRSIMVNIKR